MPGHVVATVEDRNEKAVAQAGIGPYLSTPQNTTRHKQTPMLGQSVVCRCRVSSRTLIEAGCSSARLRGGRIGQDQKARL